MKVTKKTSVQGDWAKPKEDINDGDLIKILDEGEKVVGGDFGDRDVFKVLTKNGEKNLSFNQTTINYLIEVFGDETEKWVDEKVKAWVVKQMVGGKMKNVIYLTAPDWIEVGEKFCPPTEAKKGKGKKAKEVEHEDIPIIEEDK